MNNGMSLARWLRRPSSLCLVTILIVALGWTCTACDSKNKSYHGDSSKIKDINEAAFTWKIERVAALLKDNPDLVYSRDDTGKTPLHWAVATPFSASMGSSLAKLLLAKGADVNAIDNEGRTPLFYAQLVEANDSVVNLLVKNGGEDATAQFYANIRRGTLKELRALLDKYPNPGSQKSCLLAAASFNRKDVVELLLDRGVDVNSKRNDGMTPLHYAAQNGHKDVVELLLAKGAELNATAVNGMTPFHYAAQNGHKDVVELLRQHGGH